MIRVRLRKEVAIWAFSLVHNTSKGGYDGRLSDKFFGRVV